MANDVANVSEPLISPLHSNTKGNQIIPCNDAKNENGIQSSQWFDSLLEKQKFSFKQVFLLFFSYLILGTLCFFLTMHQIEGKKTDGLIDAIYFCVITMTTVGYGDLLPHTTLAKLLACIYVLIGMTFVGVVLSKAADYIVEKQEYLLVKAIHMNQKFGPEEISKEVQIHKVKYKFMLAACVLVVLVIIGVCVLCFVEELEFVDALYCVFSTMTTLGYGDESFSTKWGRVFGALWILSSTICLAQFFLYLTEWYTETRQKMLIQWVLTRKVTRADLESADLDHDKVVSAAEFIVYALKEMGKINEEDIELVMERFRKLGVDKSGTLTQSDLLQSSSIKSRT